MALRISGSVKLGLFRAMDAYVQLWCLIKDRVERVTGLWRINEIAWNRRARQCESLAGALGAVGLAGAAAEFGRIAASHRRAVSRLREHHGHDPRKAASGEQA